jgi:hypothetical protein
LGEFEFPKSLKGVKNVFVFFIHRDVKTNPEEFCVEFKSVEKDTREPLFIY